MKKKDSSYINQYREKQIWSQYIPEGPQLQTDIRSKHKNPQNTQKAKMSTTFLSIDSVQSDSVILSDQFQPNNEVLVTEPNVNIYYEEIDIRKPEIKRPSNTHVPDDHLPVKPIDNTLPEITPK